ncbi:MAG: hypothetical protein KKI12_10990 [Proteobacteria bacterium]|nr:hypothetical protein [Pseudomonadota bacterium]
MMEFIASNLTLVFICILILIGVKFYWFAEYVDSNKKFQQLLEKNGENLKIDYCLRVLWVLPPLSLPAILLGDIFIELAYKINILFVMFIIMFAANIFWSWLFLDYLETISAGLTPGRKALILLPDFISALAFGFGLAGSYLITLFEVPMNSTYLIFFVCCAITSIFITLQLLVFVPGVIARNWARFSKDRKK